MQSCIVVLHTIDRFAGNSKKHTKLTLDGPMHGNQCIKQQITVVVQVIYLQETFSAASTHPIPTSDPGICPLGEKPSPMQPVVWAQTEIFRTLSSVYLHLVYKT